MDYVYVVLEFVHAVASVVTIAGFIIDLRKRNEGKEDASNKSKR